MCESNPPDEMTSFEVLNNTEMTDSILAEFSIIPESPPTPEEPLTNGNNFDNMQSAFMSASPDLSMHEVQSRIVELAKDNASMREALEWSNVMMKEQLSTISAWHNQMTTTMSKQQLSLKESSDKLTELERENAELKEKLKQLENNSKETCSQESKSVQYVASCTDDPLVAELKQKLEEQKLEDNKRVEATALRLEEAEQMVLELKLKLEEQTQELSALKKSASERDAFKSEYELAKIEHEALELKCISLDQQLRESKVEESYNKRMHESEVQSLKKKISDLETEVILKSHGLEGESIKHAETRKLLSILQTKYDRVSSLLQAQTQDSSSCSNRFEEEKRYLEQIDNLTAQLFALEEKLAEREEKVCSLSSRLQTVDKDSESIPVLKSQVEVYKLELNQAKQYKEEADVEIQRLKQMVRDLEARLEEDTVVLDGEGAHSRPKRNGKQHAGGARQGAKLYVCPLCNFGFNDAQAAQNHANKCLDEAQSR